MLFYKTAGFEPVPGQLLTAVVTVFLKFPVQRLFAPWANGKRQGIVAVEPQGGHFCGKQMQKNNPYWGTMNAGPFSVPAFFYVP